MGLIFIARERLPERSAQVEGLDEYLPAHEYIAQDDLAPTPEHVHRDFPSK